jgi:hypothetical protein
LVTTQLDITSVTAFYNARRRKTAEQESQTLMEASMTELMTPAELSAQIHTPPETLQYWRSHGKGPRYGRIGKRVVYRTADVEAWLTSCFSD